jgi:putative transposase
MRDNAKKKVSVEEETLPLRMASFMREGLREFVLAAGMSALALMFEQDRTELCGPRYRHDDKRRNVRAGKTRGELVLGGRKVIVDRPRVRSVEGQEVALPSWAEFAKNDPLMERVVEQMLVGVSTRRYERSLEAVPEELEQRGTSKSAVSRRFVAATESKMNEWLTRRLDAIDLVCLMIDGVHVHEHVVLVALGIDAEGDKHVLGVRMGATENATVTSELIADLVERGLRTERPLLAVIDGSKALRKAIRDAFGEHVIVQRCQVHKMRNVIDHLPESMHANVRATMRQAYRSRDAKRAKKQLENLARALRSDHPDASRSLEEGLDETLSVMELGLPRQLERVLSTTNAIENLIGRARDTTHRIKRWRDGEMVLRWMITAVQDASTRFRKVMSYPAIKSQLIPALVALGDNRERSLVKKSKAA